MENLMVVKYQARTHDNHMSVVIVKNIKEKEDFYDPFMKAITKEVRRHKVVVQRRILRAFRWIPVMLMPFMMTRKAFAKTPVEDQIPVNFPLLEKAYGLDILPDEIVTTMIQLIVGCGVVGVSLAILCLMVAGGYRMVGQTDKAKIWSMDIIKGLGQILIAPVLILLLVTITALMFRNIPGLELFF